MLLAILAMLVAGAPSVLSFALQSTATIEPGKPYQHEWAHSGEKDPFFRLKEDGKLVRDFTAAELTITAGPSGERVYTTNPGVMAPYTSAQVGTHNYTLHAVVKSVTGTDLESAPLTMTVNVGWTDPPPPVLRWNLKGTATVDAAGNLTIVLTGTPEK